MSRLHGECLMVGRMGRNLYVDFFRGLRRAHDIKRQNVDETRRVVKGQHACCCGWLPLFMPQTYLLNLHIPSMQVGGEIAPFNPLAWQVLRVIGAVLVIEPSALPLPLPHAAWNVAAVAVELAAFGVQVSVYLAEHGYGAAMIHPLPWSPVITWMQDFIRIDSAKRNLHPLRLANILAWA